MMTDAEVSETLKSTKLLEQARRVFASEVARLEQAEAQRIPPTPIERRRMEYNAVREIAAKFGVDADE